LFFRLINNVVTKEEGGYMDKLLERFLQYVSLDTQSKPGVRQVPSTEGQWKLLRLLQAQLQEMGLVNVTLSEKGTIMGTLPANVEGDIPAIGFISHVDTSPDFSGKNVNPQIVKLSRRRYRAWYWR
jgi:tripeptide aminopeptidase